MKKRHRSIILLVGVLAFMAAGYWLATNYLPAGGEGDDAPAATANPDDVVRFSPDKTSADLVSLAVDYMSEEYVIEQKVVQETTTDSEGAESTSDVTVWYLSNRDDISASSSKLSSIVSSFCSLASTKLVAEAADDIGQFGFGGGAGESAGTGGADGTGGSGGGVTRLRAVFSDGLATDLEIGAKNPTSDGYYARRAGESRIYLCSSYTSERFMIKKIDIADLAVFALEEADIVQMDFARQGENVFTAHKKGEYSWELSSPIVASINSEMLGQVLEAIKQVDASAYDEIGAEDLSPYGLDAPRYRLSLATEDGGGATLLIGNEKSRGATAYAMLEGSRDVFTLSLSAFGFLDKPIREIVDAFAYIVSIGDVTRIAAEFGGRTVDCEITTVPDDSDSDVFVVDGRDVSALENSKGNSAFRAFYQALIGATVYDLDVGAEPECESEIVYTYTLKNEPYTMRVEFVPKDDRLYYVMRNGEYSGILVEKRKFDAEGGLYATYAEMMAAADAADAAAAEAAAAADAGAGDGTEAGTSAAAE
jgi:hypothetical protein